MLRGHWQAVEEHLTPPVPWASQAAQREAAPGEAKRNSWDELTQWLISVFLHTDVCQRAHMLLKTAQSCCLEEQNWLPMHFRCCVNYLHKALLSPCDPLQVLNKQTNVSQQLHFWNHCAPKM